MFTLEYSQWFDFLLPGLDALGIPIPLGGTSNHFRLDVLRRLGAWDPYNVTEDADLGLRMTAEGLRVGVVNSTTFEEANVRLGNWIRQRSRWLKGYMQTWLVHMRQPVALYRALGHVGFWGFQFFIGGPLVVALLNPILWAIFLAWAVGGLELAPELFPTPVLYISIFNLLFGNFMLVYFGVLAATKRGYHRLVPFGLLLPAYWVLHSIAGYKGFIQLVTAPHYWEKTVHGLSAVTRQEIARANAV
jgi:cellulose synthase/poly-beta-1,6-N-acetylglucosamine synthase-like glycosyltransferase